MIKATLDSGGWMTTGSPWFLFFFSPPPSVFLWLILKDSNRTQWDWPSEVCTWSSWETEPKHEEWVKLAAAWSLGERSKGSPCRRPRRASLCPPPGTDGTASLVCLSASRCAAEQGRKHKCDWFPVHLEHSGFHSTKCTHIVVVTAGMLLFLYNMFIYRLNLLQLHFKTGVRLCVRGSSVDSKYSNYFLYINCSIALGVQCMGPFVQCFL